MISFIEYSIRINYGDIIFALATEFHYKHHQMSADRGIDMSLSKHDISFTQILCRKYIFQILIFFWLIIPLKNTILIVSRRKSSASVHFIYDPSGIFMFFQKLGVIDIQWHVYSLR